MHYLVTNHSTFFQDIHQQDHLGAQGNVIQVLFVSQELVPPPARCTHPSDLHVFKSNKVLGFVGSCRPLLGLNTKAILVNLLDVTVLIFCVLHVTFFILVTNEVLEAALFVVVFLGIFSHLRGDKRYYTKNVYDIISDWLGSKEVRIASALTLERTRMYGWFQIRLKFWTS